MERQEIDTRRPVVTNGRLDVSAPTSPPSLLAIALAVGLSYYVAARVGFALTFRPYLVSTLWAPNAVLLAALLLIPLRSWWAVLLGVFPAHVIVELQVTAFHWLILVWYVSNISEVVIAALLVRWLASGPPRFDSFRRIGAFAIGTFVAVVFSTLLAAPLVLHGATEAVYWDVWRIRLWSNMLALLTATPAIVALGSGGIRYLRHLSPRRAIEVGVFIVALLGASAVAFGWQSSGPGTDSALLYAPVPLLLWAAVRFGPGGVSGSVFVVALLTLWAAVHDRGPFLTRTPAENALSIQLLFIMGSLALLFLTAAVREREQARETARENQETAREAREQLEAALNAAAMGSWEWRINDSQIAVSAEGARALGLADGRRTLGVDEFYERVHPDDRCGVADALSRAVMDKASTEIEFRVIRPDGGLRWILTKGRVVENRLGPPVRMLGLGLDVTERTKADALKVAQNGILEMVAVGAPLGDVLDALADLVESQIDGVRCSVMAPGIVGDAEMERSHLENGTTPSDAWSAPILSREGSILGQCILRCREPWTASREQQRLIDAVTAMATVAIERWQGDQALRLSYQRYRLATTGGNVGVWDWDLESNYLYVDPYVNEMLGYEDNEIDDRLEAWVAHIHPDDRSRVLALVSSGIESGQSSYELKHRMVHRDGTVRWVFARGTVIRNEAGQAVRVVGTSSDVTERVRVKAEMEEQQRQLAHLGRAAVLGELSGALAHELNQPLSAILANAAAGQRYLTKVPSSPDVTVVQEILEDIVHDDHRAAAVIARLRSLLKKGELRVQRLDLNEVVTDVLEVVHSDLIERRVSVESRLAPGLSPICADRVQAQQVLLNLILNGCDAMSENAPRDRVLRIMTEMCDGTPRLSIVDRGRGIPAASMDRIFEPFFTSKQDGLGLGLAICQSIMRAHGGRLWATNNPAEGATFSVEFPRDAPGARVDRSAAAAVVSGRTPIEAASEPAGHGAG